jgi:hypothetical protein
LQQSTNKKVLQANMDIFSTPMSSFKKYGQGHGYKECDIALVMAKWEEHIEKLDKIDVETK